MASRKVFHFIAALSIALLTLVSRTQALAGSGLVTRGDVEATLQSWDTGLRAVLFTSKSVTAAQADGFQRGRIIPAADGRHYCAEDWHVVLIAWVTGGDLSFKRQDAVADLSSVQTTFILDGVTLATKQTPIVRRVVPFIGDIDYGFAVGSILSPTAISVGTHTISMIATFSDGSPSVEFTSTIYMDPSGSGACVQ
jgi:hypothetical protein